MYIGVAGKGRPLADPRWLEAKGNEKEEFL